MTSETSTQDPQSLSRIEVRFARLMATLEREYQHLRPEFEAEGFKQRVYERLANQLRDDPARLMNPDGQFDPDRLHAFIGEIELATLPVRHDVWNIHAACAHCILAEIAFEKNEVDQAWDQFVDAAMYLGWVLSVKRGPDVYDHAVHKSVKSSQGRKAAKGRHKVTDAMKEAAYAHVIENGGFPSQLRAAASIESMLRAKFPTAKPLSDPEGTIERWLRDMPRREEYFDTLKKSVK